MSDNDKARTVGRDPAADGAAAMLPLRPLCDHPTVEQPASRSETTDIKSLFAQIFATVRPPSQTKHRGDRRDRAWARAIRRGVGGFVGDGNRW
jgi:hypothetical protein